MALNGWSIFWLLAILFLGWWLGFLFAWLYVLLLPFSVCCDFKELMDTLERFMKIPGNWAQNLMDGKSL